MSALREILRFELLYQRRRTATRVYAPAFLLLVMAAILAGIGDARRTGTFLDAPINLAELALVASQFGLLVVAALAGDAATRDTHTRLGPLVHTTPVGRTAWVGGHFLGAFAIQALLLVAVPVLVLAVTRLGGVEPELVAPFRPAAHLGAYFFIALPNAFVATALLFAVAALTRRAMAAYLAAAVLFVGVMLVGEVLASGLGHWTVARYLDPFGFVIGRELSQAMTPAERSTRLIGLTGALLWNRLLWIGIAVATLAVVRMRVRLGHHAEAGRAGRHEDPTAAGRDGATESPVPFAPRRPGAVAPSFGLSTHLHQSVAIARRAFRDIALGRAGLVLLGIAAALVVLGPELMEDMGTPVVATTERVVALFRASELRLALVAPLLALYYAGELLWQEREARLGEIADTAPTPDWVPFLGKFLGLALVLATAQALLIVAGIGVQLVLGHPDVDLAHYLRVFLGLQLVDALLVAALAMAVHAVVDQKYVGHLVTLLAIGLARFAPMLDLRHNLLRYGGDPGWQYTELRGFGPDLAPVLWFELYWAGWALLLAVIARLLWVRGRERGWAQRVRLARRRLTRPVALTAGAAAAVVVGTGAFLFWNTNVLHAYRTADEGPRRRAEYERRYGRFDAAAQPWLAGASLRIELHPERRRATVRGTYRLVNATAAPIDTIHLATASEVETRAVGFDRPADELLADRDLGHRIYRLREPLRPGDSLRLTFEVHHAPRGFANEGADGTVIANGTRIVHQEWLPALGYQPARELSGAGDRRDLGLPPRAGRRSLDDSTRRHDVRGRERIAFEAVIGTSADQIAVAPGTLRREWTENGRRWFHYVADAPIRNGGATYSARYAVHESRWNDVSIRVLHHPGHAWNAGRIAEAARASLEHLSSQLGPYPHRQLTLVEFASGDVGATALPGLIAFAEGMALLDPAADARGFDFLSAIVAHEVAHQWWGNQLTPALVEGAPLLAESLAWYSAMGVVERAQGAEALGGLLGLMREAYLTPRSRADAPLLRATDDFLAYRKGPFAMHALRAYVGDSAVTAALRRLLAAHGRGLPPLPTSRDLYAELRAAAPDSLHPLLHDLFEVNASWELAARAATAEPAGRGRWRVTLDVEARKVTVDSLGTETALPMDDPIEIGVHAAGADGEAGAPLYLQRHRIRAGRQRIVVTVSGEPSHAGIDPRRLLIDVNGADNVVAVAPPSP